MKYTKPAATMAVVIAVAAVAVSATAQAQTKPVQGWTPPQRQELDPAKRVPVATQPASVATQQGAAGDSVQAQPVAQPVTQPAPASYQAPPPYGTQAYEPTEERATYEEGRGGFFLGVKGGKGWVYDDVDQSAREINAGYRWQAGAVALVGIEVAGGKLEKTTERGVPYNDVDYGSIGVNARFNFGRNSPVYGLVRAGYMSAEMDDPYGSVDVDGGYFGLGLGVDINRHFNLSLTYTNYVYFNELYWEEGTLNYDADRADTLMLGAEVRF